MKELLELISEVNKSTCSSPEEVGKSFLHFKKVVEDFNKLSGAEQHEIIKNFFINNPEDCVEFAKRHPSSPYNKYIKSH